MQASRSVCSRPQHSSKLTHWRAWHRHALCVLLVHLLLLQVLYDAFFKHQRKPRMTALGELYYEGKEYEARLEHLRPGVLSPELREALGMTESSPPPWLVNMQVSCRRMRTCLFSHPFVPLCLSANTVLHMSVACCVHAPLLLAVALCWSASCMSGIEPACEQRAMQHVGAMNRTEFACVPCLQGEDS